MSDTLSGNIGLNEVQMMHNIDFPTASSESIAGALCKRLDEIRLSRNISQEDLAADAGVSRSTLSRLADGRPISLDTFVRVMQALKLTDHLAALLPDPAIRPVDRVRLDGAERQRARGKRVVPSDWRWGDEGDEE
jgi:transcriptional regulator with XRE-family HTH domain